MIGKVIYRISILEFTNQILFFIVNHAMKLLLMILLISFLGTDLRRHFFEPPYSRSVSTESQVELRCLPPEGQPPPRTSWLKNDRPIDYDTQLNYRCAKWQGFFSQRFPDYSVLLKKNPIISRIQLQIILKVKKYSNFN